jgi:hypothetical protein
MIRIIETQNESSWMQCLLPKALVNVTLDPPGLQAPDLGVGHSNMMNNNQHFDPCSNVTNKRGM